MWRGAVTDSPWLAVFLLAALCRAGAEEGPGAGPLDRAGFRERVLELIERAPRGAPATSKELVALVTAYRWHAFHVVMEWLDALEAPAAGNRRELLLERARAVVKVLSHDGGSGQAGPIVETVASWGEAEWQSYHQAESTRQEGKALLGRGALQAAAKKLDEVRARLTKLGRLDSATWATIDLVRCYENLGRFSDAVAVGEANLQVATTLGCDHCTAPSLGSLGNIYARLGRHEDARASYMRCLELGERMGDDNIIAASSTGLGGVEARMGNFQEAVRCFERGAVLNEKVGDRRGLAVDVGNLGVLYVYLEQYDKAVKVQERALSIFKELGSEQDIAMSQSNLALVHLRTGKLEEAKRLMESSQALLEKLGAEQQLGENTLNLASVHSELGEHEKALELQKRALEISEHIGNPQDIALVLNNLGLTYTSLGDYEEGLRHQERALELYERTKNPLEVALVTLNIGIVYAQLRQDEKAKELFERALHLYEGLGVKQSIALVLQNLAGVCDYLGHADLFLKYTERSLALRREIGNESEISSSLLGLGQHWRGRDNGRALSLMEESLAMCERVGNDDNTAATLHDLAILTDELGDRRKAVDLFQRAIALEKRVGNQNDLARSHIEFSQLLAKLGRLEESRTQLRSGLDALARMRSKFSSDRERVSFAETWQSELLPMLRTALRSKPPIEPDLPLALRALESLRGVATADLFASSIQGIRGSATPQLTAEERRLSKKIDDLEARLQETYRETSSTLADNKRREDIRDDLRAEQRRLEAAWQDAFARIARANPQYAALRRPDPITLEALQRLLPPRSAYLAYVLGKPRSLVIAVDRDGIRHFDLAPAGEIEEATERYLALIRRAPGPGAAARILGEGRKLSDLLVGPTREVLARHKRLFVAPEGALYGLPFEALIGPQSDPGVAGDLRLAPFLVKTHAITYVHSATVWSLHLKRLRARQKDAVPGSGNGAGAILVLADPISPGEERRKDKSTEVDLAFAPLRGAGLGRLPHSRREGFSILEAFAGKDGLKGLGPNGWQLEVGGKARRAGPLPVRAPARSRARASSPRSQGRGSSLEPPCGSIRQPRSAPRVRERPRALSLHPPRGARGGFPGQSRALGRRPFGRERRERVPAPHGCPQPATESRNWSRSPPAKPSWGSARAARGTRGSCGLSFTPARKT